MVSVRELGEFVKQEVFDLILLSFLEWDNCPEFGMVVGYLVLFFLAVWQLWNSPR